VNRLLHTTRSARRTLAVRSTSMLAAALTVGLTAGLVAGCSPDDDAPSSTTASEVADADAVSPDASTDNEGRSAADVMAENLDYAETAALVDQTWDADDEVAVTLSGSSASADDDAVTVDDGTVTITAPGTYRLTGTLAGQVVVDSSADGVVRLVLDGATITSSTSAAIAVTDSDQVSVVLADGSDNALTDATTYEGADEDNAPNAALFSTADLAISGGGTLTVTGQANDGIGAKDGLVIDADVQVTAVDDGVRGKDYLVVQGGTITVDADGGHALKSDNDSDSGAGYVLLAGGDVSVTSGEDGVNAATDVVITGGTLTVDAGDDGVHADLALVIEGGTVTVKQSEEGLEGTDITLAGGTIDVTSNDDGVNASDGTTTAADATAGDNPGDNPGDMGGGPGGAAPGDMPSGMPSGMPTDMPSDLPTDGAGRGGGGMPGGGMPGEGATVASLTISGGTITVNADGDGLDSNGTITMSGGDVVVQGPTNDGNGALDSASGITISGGMLVAVGSAGMAETPDTGSPQPWVAARLDSAAQAGTTLTVTGPDGTAVAQVTVAKSAAAIIVSTPDVTADGTYTITGDDGASTSVPAGQSISGGFGPR
jgi:hypothetical protein